MASHKITLHHLNSSRSQRLFWLLEELGQPYDVEVHFRLPTRQAPPSLHAVSPFGKAPVVVLDGETLTESGYIVHRLISLFPDTADIETTPSNNSIFWSHFAEGSMMNLLQAGATVGALSAGWQGGAFGQIGDEEKEGIKKFAGFLTEKYLRRENQKNLDEIEDFLRKHPGKYFSGTDKPGEADFMMFFAIYSYYAGSRKDMGYNLGPSLRKWYDMVMARPAVKRGMERLAEEEKKAQAKI